MNLMHRGAAGADESTGDGAGILMQLPHEFFAAEAERLGFALPAAGQLRRGDGLPAARRRARAGSARRLLAEAIAAGGLAVLGWRDVPCDNRCLGEIARAAEPVIRQVFIGGEGLEDEELERRLYRGPQAGRAARARASWASRRDEFYIPSMSCRTIVYKGMFLAPQLFAYYPTWPTRGSTTALAIVHQRYSTNTFPSWRLAQPFRMIAHNGEINTLRGNMQPPAGLREDDGLPGAGRRPVGPVADPRAGRERFGLLRQLHGAAGACRPLAPRTP